MQMVLNTGISLCICKKYGFWQMSLKTLFLDCFCIDGQQKGQKIYIYEHILICMAMGLFINVMRFIYIFIFQ